MIEIKKDFNIPFYIFEEIVQYIEQSAQGRCRCSKWNNIKALLRLAKVNDRLSSEQVEYIIKNYCRE